MKNAKFGFAHGAFFWGLAVLGHISFPAFAEFVVVNEAPLDWEDVMEKGSCNIVKRGEISSDDAQLFKDLLEKHEQFAPTDSGDSLVTLCFQDSTGGSYIGGVLLAKEIVNGLVTTVVMEGSECLSACAIAFLGGIAPYFNEGVLPFRLVHPTSRLGFHAPNLNSDIPVEDSPLAGELFNSAILAIGELLQLEFVEFQNRLPVIGRVINEDLIGVIMGTPHDSMYLVSNLHDLMRFDIWPVGNIDFAINESDLPTLCGNMIYWAGRTGDLSFMLAYNSVHGLEQQGADDWDPLAGADVKTTALDPHFFTGRENDTRVQLDHEYPKLRSVVTFSWFHGEFFCEVLHDGFSDEAWGGPVHLIEPLNSAYWYLGHARGIHSLRPETALSELTRYLK